MKTNKHAYVGWQDSLVQDKADRFSVEGGNDSNVHSSFPVKLKCFQTSSREFRDHRDFPVIFGSPGESRKAREAGRKHLLLFVSKADLMVPSCDQKVQSVDD